MDSSKVKYNHFSPPFVARYVRIQPVDFKQRPALRLELLGCDLNSEFHLQQHNLSVFILLSAKKCSKWFFVCVCPGCSIPLGLQMGLIPDNAFNASSVYSSLLGQWKPSLARLHQQGRFNAWRPKVPIHRCELLEWLRHWHTTVTPHHWVYVEMGNWEKQKQGFSKLLTN